MTDWTEPDHADEGWVPPWEGDYYDGCSDGPEFRMAYNAELDDFLGKPDFYAPRPRWVSDRP